MTNVSYLDYPANKPQEDGYYLVSVKQALILKLGLAPSPSILIARYKSGTQEWTPILGTIAVGLGNIENEVISWHSLPLP